jgi:hypothetical protein
MVASDRRTSVVIKPPPSIPLPPITITPGQNLPPTTIIPSVPEWSKIDLENLDVIEIPAIPEEGIGGIEYKLSYKKQAQAYRPQEYDDPSWTGGYKEKKATKDLNKGKSKDDVPDWARSYRPRTGEKELILLKGYWIESMVKENGNEDLILNIIK